MHNTYTSSRVRLCFAHACMGAQAMPEAILPVGEGRGYRVSRVAYGQLYQDSFVITSAAVGSIPMLQDTS